MKREFTIRFGLVALPWLGAVNLSAAPASDIISPLVRRESVDLAKRIAQTGTPSAVPADVVNPFNPAAFFQPDPEELRAMAAAKSAEAAALAKSKPTSGPALLNLICDQISPSGTLELGDEQILVVGQKKLRVGDRVAITYDQQVYELEITGIDRSSFKVRLNRDEITRRIQPRKNP